MLKLWRAVYHNLKENKCNFCLILKIFNNFKMTFYKIET